MPRERLTFRQRDVTAAVRALMRAGLKVTRVEIERDGRIIVNLAPVEGNDTAPGSESNPWDRVFEDAYKP